MHQQNIYKISTKHLRKGKNINTISTQYQQKGYLCENRSKNHTLRSYTKASY